MSQDQLRTAAQAALQEVERLFGLLDDIDTASDIAKSDNARYRKIVEPLQRKRFDNGITTDGYNLNGSVLEDLRAALREDAMQRVSDIGQEMESAALAANKPTTPPLRIEQYRLQMAGISTAAYGYWKEGDEIHPDYDTSALRDVAKLYAKYDALYQQMVATSVPKEPADDGLLHDKAHVDTGAVRAAQSVRTEMSYRPGSLRLDAPEPVPLHPNLPTPTDTFGKPDTIAQWVICPHCKGKSPMRPAEQTAQPVVWMQSDHLNKFIRKFCGSASMLARCSDHQVMADYKPLYLHPPEDAKDAARFRWSRDTQKLWTPEEYVAIVDAAMKDQSHD